MPETGNHYICETCWDDWMQAAWLAKGEEGAYEPTPFPPTASWGRCCVCGRGAHSMVPVVEARIGTPEMCLGHAEPAKVTLQDWATAAVTAWHLWSGDPDDTTELNRAMGELTNALEET